MSVFDCSSTINLQALIVGVQLRSNHLMMLAEMEGEKPAALERRLIQLEGMAELLGLAKEPHQASIDWLAKHRKQLTDR